MLTEDPCSSEIKMCCPSALQEMSPMSVGWHWTEIDFGRSDVVRFEIGIRLRAVWLVESGVMWKMWLGDRQILEFLWEIWPKSVRRVMLESIKSRLGEISRNYKNKSGRDR